MHTIRPRSIARIVLLFMIVVSHGLEQDLAVTAAQRAGAHGVTAAVLAGAPPLAGGARLLRSLSGRGFHRTLRLQLRAARGGGGAPCTVALLQPLPSGLFADPYQLEDLARARPGARFDLLGPVDLEL